MLIVILHVYFCKSIQWKHSIYFAELHPANAPNHTNAVTSFFWAIVIIQNEYTILRRIQMHFILLLSRENISIFLPVKSSKIHVKMSLYEKMNAFICLKSLDISMEKHWKPSRSHWLCALHCMESGESKCQWKIAIRWLHTYERHSRANRIYLWERKSFDSNNNNKINRIFIYIQNWLSTEKFYLDLEWNKE